MNPFDFVNSINHTKKNLIEEDPSCEKDYVPFLTNRSLSYFVDTLLYSNEMNKSHFIDNKLQYDFYLNSLKPRKRFAPWVKRETLEHLELVKEYYGYNHNKALAALRILTKSQLDEIKILLNKGRLQK